MSLTVSLFRWMLREEWRLHSDLFGGRRFGAFPVAVFVLSLGAFQLLAFTGTPFGAVAAGLHGLLFFFGLQVGTIGLVGRDTLRDVLGDVTLLVFSARTLPVTWTRLLAVFLVKDLLYYTAFFLAPIGLAVALTAVGTGLGPESVLVLWVTLVGVFALGVTLSLTLAGLATRSRLAVIAVVVAVAGVLLVPGVDLLAYTPYGFFRDPTALAALRGFVPVVVFAVVGPLVFRPAENRAQRTSAARFGQLRRLLGDTDGVATRALLEVLRSSGSVWKVLFSMGVLFGVTALLLREVSDATALQPSPGIAFGTLLGLGAFTTYSWVTQFDGDAEYRRYPVTMRAVFAGKRRVYLLLSVGAGLVYLAVAAWWFDPVALASGVVVLPLVALYVFGVTAYVTGLSATTLLFDTPLFVAFGAALAVVATPLLVAALAYPVAPTLTTGLAVGISVVAGAVGILLSARAGPRWDRRLREGD